MSDHTWALWGRHVRLRLIALLLAGVAGTTILVGVQASGAFERAVTPEIDKRARLIGVIVRAELQRALELGITLESIRGLDRYLAETLKKFDEVDQIVVRSVQGASVASVRRHAVAGATPAQQPAPTSDAEAPGWGRYVLPVLDGNRQVGEIRVDVSPVFVRTRLREVFFDVGAIALVVTLVAVELILLVAAAAVTRPLDRVFHLLGEQGSGDFRRVIDGGGLSSLARVAERLNDHARDLAERLARLPSTARDKLRGTLDVHIADGAPKRLRRSDAGDMRLALFLFSTAAEVTVAFLPMYARSMARPSWLTPELAAAAPLVCYLAAAAVLAPLGGWLAHRLGARRLFVLSIPPAALCLVALSTATHVGEVMLWRGLMAVFYATATIACQEYALRAAPAALASGAFVSGVYGGVFCGAALGGIVAGRFGVEMALLGGATLAMLAGLVGWMVLRGPAGDPATDAAPESVLATAQGRRPVLIAIAAGLAVPMNVATAVFVWYLTPLTLSASGADAAEVARVVMLYYLSTVLLGPLVAAASAGLGLRRLVVVGASLAGAALWITTWLDGYWATVAAVAGLGIGHTLLRAPLYALASQVGGTVRTMGAFRAAERIGAIAGLGVCAWLLPSLGPAWGTGAAAILTLAGLATFLAVELGKRRRPVVGDT